MIEFLAIINAARDGGNNDDDDDDANEGGDKFAKYVKDFYGVGGKHPMGATTQMIAKSIKIYFDMLIDTDDMDWGGGSSVDREHVRDIMIEEFKLEWK